MDRRKFLERMVVAASVAAVTPIIRNAIPSVGGEEVAEGESLPAFPIQDRLIASRTNQSELAKRFVHPPESAAPWVYWMWINIDTTPAAMTFDLEQMKAKGIPGFILYNSPSGREQAVLVAESRSWAFYRRSATRRPNRSGQRFENGG